VTAWLVGSLIATSFLVGLVLLLRGPVLRTFGPNVAYALWALPALRMVLPPLPAWFAPVPETLGTAVPPLAIATAGAHALTILPSPSVTGLGGATLLFILWATGSIGWFGWQMLRYRFFLGRALRDAKLLGRECGVDVLVSPAVTGPMATGVLVKRILLPTDIVHRYTSGERRLALLHEGAHHDRRDILANLAALGFVAVHWWNPLAHFAYRCFRADQELACDATVLGGVGGDDRHAYGSALLKSASARTTTVACALSHKDELRRRLVTMTRPGFGMGRRITGAGAALMVVIAGVALTATAQAGPLPDMDDMSAWFAPTAAQLDGARHDLMAGKADMDRFAAQSERDGRSMSAQVRGDAHDAERMARESRRMSRDLDRNTADLTGPGTTL